MSKDLLYLEGIVLGDYVVNEFLSSPSVSDILVWADLKHELSSRLRTELQEFRARTIQVLQEAGLIGLETPKVEQSITLTNNSIVPSSSSFIPLSPRDVSRNVLSALKAMPLAGQTFVSSDSPNRQPLAIADRPVASESSSTVTVSISYSPTKPTTGQKSALISGIRTDDLFEEDILGGDKRPQTPTEPLKLINHESLVSMDLFAVLNSSVTPKIPKNVPKRRRQSTREVSGGVFLRDGTYYAIAYGGFIHLCGGALEWPFKTAELEFNKFFQN